MNYRVLLLASLAVCSNAYGETKESEARALFKQARELTSEGKLDQACSKFEKSLKLEAGIGTQFNLADCWQRIGRTASAYRLFLRTAEAAKQLSQSERAQVAEERAHSLLPQLSHLRINGAVENTQITVSAGESKLNEDDWSEPVVVDPGHYTVTIVSAEAETWSAEVDVPATANVLVTVPRRQAAEALEPKAAVAEKPRREKQQSAAARSVAPKLPNREAAVLTEQRSYLWPTVALVTGIGGLGFGTLFALDWKSNNDQARSICPAGVGCSDAEISRHQDLVRSARTDRALAYLAFGVGLVGITTSTILFSAGSTKRERPLSVGLGVAPAVGSGQQLVWAASANGTW